MKIKNLYIGNICMVKKVEYSFGLCYWDAVEKISYSQRPAILYRKNINSNYAMDIVTRIKYPIGIRNGVKEGDEFINKLVSVLSNPELAEMANKNISRRNVLKYFEFVIDEEVPKIMIK